jgi:nucleoside-diphosphate-sugar epimerase
MEKILITGISGLVGSTIAAQLKDDYTVTGIDLSESLIAPTTIADCTKLNGILSAFDGIDIVIDLASNPNQYMDWEMAHNINLLCTSNALEAARISGVKRLIYASSNHATGMYESDSPYKEIVSGEYDKLNSIDLPLLSSDMPIRPDGPYGIAKAFGEAAGRHYSDQYDISVICLRIGTVNKENKPLNKRQFSTWLSHSDLGKLIKCSITANDSIKFGIYYGVSNNKWRFWDISNSIEDIGYAPDDNAEAWR